MSKRSRIGGYLDDEYLRTVDRISNLPWPILEEILGRLPIKDAVKTTILSRQWRNKWFDLSKLHFNDFSLGTGGEYKPNLDLLINSVYHVLLCHRGPIHSFELSTFNRLNFSDLDNWIRFISRKNIKELTFEHGIAFNTINKYAIPRSLFCCQQLTHLRLQNAILCPPYTFPGFRNLVSLGLKNYTNDSDVLASLIRKCPVLERVELDNFQNFVCLKIEALKLEYLLLNGLLGTIVLENCPVLAHVSFITFSDVSSTARPGQKEFPHHFFYYLGRLPSLKSLTLYGHFLKQLQEWDSSDTTCTAFNHLKVLKLNYIHIDDLRQIKAALATLKLFFSNLQELEISVDKRKLSDQTAKFLDEQRGSSCCCLESLKNVKIDIIPGCYCDYWDPELKLIKFLLARSPVLEKMTIVNNKFGVTKIETEFMRELLPCKRASSEVEIALCLF